MAYLCMRVLYVLSKVSIKMLCKKHFYVFHHFILNNPKPVCNLPKNLYRSILDIDILFEFQGTILFSIIKASRKVFNY